MNISQFYYENYSSFICFVEKWQILFENSQTIKLEISSVNRKISNLLVLIINIVSWIKSYDFSKKRVIYNCKS
jgi:hypothetical protein